MNRPDHDRNALIQRQPQAAAILTPRKEYPDIRGTVRFYSANDGTVVYAHVSGLPHSSDKCSQEFFGFHIHGGKSCTGNSDDPFSDAGKHFDKNNCPHPLHSGDLPPLLGNNGKAISVFLSNRFSVEDIIGKTIVIHSKPDDFTTQPGGNAGKKIACGVIRAVR
ncbi:superoxide dismutase family protein [Ruminococcus sp. FC2018]|uniref:superoxide dismutase family protein n=1 Tax=Ruminococcus sp. FC2018 TaxID=1410617 RepID=UPI000688C789|nr:superoxide dismutase family protein [Ruminococcus sp. FC2018]